MYKFLQSLLIFVSVSVESATDNQLSYLIYFACCYLIAISAWLILLRFFKVLSKEEVEQMRAGQNHLKYSEQSEPLTQNNASEADLKTTLKTGKFGGNSEYTYAANKTESMDSFGVRGVK